MRWKAFFTLNPNTNTASKETFGFKSRKAPPPVPEMNNFESRLLDMIENVEFRTVNCSFQNQLSRDIKRKIKQSDKVLVAADKTTNFYKMDPSSYTDLLRKNITKNYKIIEQDTAKSLDREAKEIATKLDLHDRIDMTAKKEAFVTLKDHKPNFENKPTCRLINPAKSEIGKISKQTLDRINTKIKAKLNLNQWKNTRSVIEWFRSVTHKSQYSFITFDVVDFYPSISADLLNTALDFASNYEEITDDERHTIMYTKKTCLHNSGQTWGKKTSSNLFDVTMGSFDGAETCELVGAFLLSIITEKYGKSFGLYRDDGLGIIKAPPRTVEAIKKDLCVIFQKYGLKITIEANKKIVNFLDVTLNLNNGKYSPYNKPNNVPLYVHCKSNHPPQIIKNIPASINQRLNEISSDAESFNKSAEHYQTALDKSGYNFQLKYVNKPCTNENAENKRKRRRNIIWYNPPFSKNTKTNIGKTFLKILDEEFDEKHPLRKIFNRNTVKISYSCMSNIKQNIDGHNKRILAQDTETPPKRECNCRKPELCPLDRQCLTESIVYQATVTTEDDRPDQTYIGLTENSFKTRFNNHKSSFRLATKKNSTELSKYIWRLKEENTDFDLSWRIIKKAKGYSPTSKRCDLCLWEKYFITCKPNLSTLNKRNELVNTCRHAAKFLLQNI